MKPFVVCGFALLSAHALLEAQLNVPQLGMARYQDGSVHLIRGVGANVIVDRHALARAGTAAFGDTGGLLAANGTIRAVLPDGTVLADYQANEPAPVLNSNGSTQGTGVAWLPSKHVLLLWDGTKFSETSVDDSSFGGTVTSVTMPASGSAQFFVSRADSSVARISVALPSGSVTSSDTEPGARGWALLQQGWTLSQDEWGLTAERANGGNRQTIQLSKQPLSLTDLHVEQMSNHWLHVVSVSSGANWVLYLDATKLNIFLLPPPKSVEFVARPPKTMETAR
jgi:hypothetical protein